MADDPDTYFSEHAADIAEINALDDMPDSYMQLLDRFTALVGDGRVLDAGCGHGKDVDYFVDNGLDAVGVDSADGMIAYAQEHKRGEYRVMDVRDLAFDEATFDGVWCNTVLQFLPPDAMDTALAEFRRVLKPDGILYTTFKLGDGPVVREEDGLTRYRIPEDDATAMVRSHGFTVLDTNRSQVNAMTVLNMFCRKG